MNRARRGISGWTVIALSAWLGLAAGLLEVATRVLYRAIAPTGRLHMMSRHFIWLTPLANLVVFLGVGLILAAAVRLWPKVGAWLSPRVLLALAIVPSLMVAVPRIFPEAWFILALGIAVRTVPLLNANPARLWRVLIGSFPALIGLVLVLAASIFVGDWLKQRREASRALPRSDSPNVLLIVLDTVRQDRLSLYGYRRPTTPTLERLAGRGIRFDGARATAPWTLPSHASLFTGRLPHELGVEWLTPIRKSFPMLAEYLGSRGYATMGLVANVGYCSSETGLGRGFTYYEDYLLKRLSPFRTSCLVEEALKTLITISLTQKFGPLQSFRESLRYWSCFSDRRDAASVNQGFLDWLASRQDTQRPFFAFLNYLDAHAPYRLPEGATHRFGRKPQTLEEINIINEGWSNIDKLTLPRPYLTMAADAYDDCIAYLDEQLGVLFDELQRRGTLDRTLVVITSDHGEGLGEHDLFDHGESLYSTEIRVPLLIVPPSGRSSGEVVRETVSLRDIPATIVDLVGLADGAPFPGESLVRQSRYGQADDGPCETDGVVSELQSPAPHDPNQGRAPIRRGPLISQADGDFVYIRNTRDGKEELFDERDDPRELTNRAGSAAMKAVVQRFREHLGKILPADLSTTR